ncbi:MAG TPA: hypothetical protein VFI46_18520 [Jiangellaceae bacterium]|nr:hypothetical protein [Jiangellaceae bacterium]
MTVTQWVVRLGVFTSTTTKEAQPVNAGTVHSSEEGRRARGICVGVVGHVLRVHAEPTLAAWWKTTSGSRQDQVERGRVANVAADDAGALDVRCVGAVEHDHLVSARTRGLHDVGADEPGTAGDQGARSSPYEERAERSAAAARP